MRYDTIFCFACEAYNLYTILFHMLRKPILGCLNHADMNSYIVKDRISAVFALLKEIINVLPEEDFEKLKFMKTNFYTFITSTIEHDQCTSKQGKVN
jgi:hypothetical protein